MSSQPSPEKNNNDRPTMERHNRLVENRFSRGMTGLGVALVIGASSLLTDPSIDPWLLGIFAILAFYNCARMVKTAYRMKK